MKCTTLFIVLALRGIVDAESCGYLPITVDDFSSGNFENFAPVYAGSSSNWMKSTFAISTANSLSPYCLQWNANNIANKWFVISNAFSLVKPYMVSIDIQLTTEFFSGSATVEVGLIGAIEKYSRTLSKTFSSKLDALRLQRKVSKSTDIYTVLLSTNSNSSNWSEGTTVQKEFVFKPNQAYTLSMAYSSNSGVTAQVLDKKSGTSVTLTSASKVQAQSMGGFIDIPATSTGNVAFAQVKVIPAPYAVPERTWVRAPHFLIIPRTPELQENQGFWVGAATGFYDKTDGIYKMWYRIRDPEKRGIGYGYAYSIDCVNWKKHMDHNGKVVPVFNPKGGESVEKICVRKVTDSGTTLYKAWYAFNTNGDNWVIAYATSTDGIHWTDHGMILSGEYYKDPEVLIVNGTYYMYVILRPDGRNCNTAVYTSQDGKNWVFRNNVVYNYHSHPGAHYAKDTKTFWFYSDYPTLSEASSTDGINFGGFSTALNPANAGLDDAHNGQVSNGVNYAFFMGDEHGHVDSAYDLPLFYQARHEYSNNSTSWNYSEDGKIVMAGRFVSHFVNVPTQIDIDGTKTYSAFPLNCTRVKGFIAVPETGTIILTILSWDLSSSTGTWTVTPSTEAAVQFQFTALSPSKSYTIIKNGEPLKHFSADAAGAFLLIDTISSTTHYSIQKG